MFLVATEIAEIGYINVSSLTHSYPNRIIQHTINVKTTKKILYILFFTGTLPSPACIWP